MSVLIVAQIRSQPVAAALTMTELAASFTKQYSYATKKLVGRLSLIEGGTTDEWAAPSNRIALLKASCGEEPDASRVESRALPDTVTESVTGGADGT